MRNQVTIPSSAELATALRQHRTEVAHRMIDNIRDLPKWKDSIPEAREQLDDFANREIMALVDYLADRFDREDDVYRGLYIGEKMKQLYDPSMTLVERQAQCRHIAERDATSIASILRGEISDAASDMLERELETIGNVLGGTPRKTVRTLFIGDCLYQDIQSFVTAPLLADDVGLDIHYITSKNPHAISSEMKSIATRPIDLVFYSPFSYEQSPLFSCFGYTKHFAISHRKLKQMCSEILRDTEMTVKLAADLFDCPIYLHNAANVHREESPWKRRLQGILTSKNRRRSSRIVNAWVETVIRERNEKTFKHLFLLDEARIEREHGAFKLGAYYRKTPLQHPAVFGRHLAELYRDVIFIHRLMMGKKLVVCDLDNTLWNGVIGEGPVDHYAERQRTLKALTRKGVVLAINSKNEPANVNWEGGVLNENDFVYADINWEPKVTGFRRISEALNLKPKDFIFIDDRADEREMASQSYPDMLCMDALSERSWRLLAQWCETLDDDSSVDRTQMYREREQRRQFIHDNEEDRRSEEAMFMSLGLRLRVHEATERDLKRVTELINRTNQWNLRGSRTTYSEVCRLHASEDHLLLLGDASDRFGDQGTVCAVSAALHTDRVEISVFVLSCRVFGYGIETAMLNHLRQKAGGRTLTGFVEETAQNQPCRNMYADHGFRENGGRWTYEGADELRDPPWLEVL